MLYIVLD